MYCEKCGREIGNDANFCDGCGHKIKQTGGGSIMPEQSVTNVVMANNAARRKGPHPAIIIVIILVVIGAVVGIVLATIHGGEKKKREQEEISRQAKALKEYEEMYEEYYEKCERFVSLMRDVNAQETVFLEANGGTVGISYYDEIPLDFNEFYYGEYRSQKASEQYGFLRENAVARYFGWEYSDDNGITNEADARAYHEMVMKLYNTREEATAVVKEITAMDRDSAFSLASWECQTAVSFVEEQNPEKREEIDNKLHEIRKIFKSPYYSTVYNGGVKWRFDSSKNSSRDFDGEIDAILEAARP
ncbi:MAG: zinc ribbon domain-containing protein [Lachnospiraceae bacterium]|nr:zinc ribbon domain-containing protein [Lachnospiraceae bacterium]